ncbi:MAG: hypothetical protein DRG27_06630 [Deltaproteobacteria bacterium]|nr:MAG: hypothetical protein DRG27_06630 [Deltaproteobacteria bacterium]
MHIFLDNQIENEFRKVYLKFKAIETQTTKEYKDDYGYFSQNITIFKPLETTCSKADFRVAAVDGSGADSLILLNDISIHLITANFSADQTAFSKGTTEQLDITLPIASQPDGVLRLVLLREDKDEEVWDEFLEFIEYNYNEPLEDIVIRILPELIKLKGLEKNYSVDNFTMENIDDIFRVANMVPFKIKVKKQDFTNFSKWMLSSSATSARGWFEQFREVLEYSLLHALLNSEHYFKYLFIDGSMNMLLSPRDDLPRLASNYLLRDLAIKAYEKNTCLVAVSKTTTFPLVYRIAQDFEKDLGTEEKWFIRLPLAVLKEKQLHMLKDRPHIPPAYGVSYLFHFSSDVPVLRIDFDLKWWLKKIHSKDKEIEKQREIELFQELDWLAREVRYFGYFFDLAFAHNNTIIRFPDRDRVAEQLIEYFAERGENPNLFIHPRKRLGLM